MRRRHFAPTKPENEQRLNEAITVPEVRLISHLGEHLLRQPLLEFCLDLLQLDFLDLHYLLHFLGISGEEALLT